MSNYTIYGEKATNRLTLIYKQLHRTNFYKSNVKHCFEATIESGCESIQAGFSPNSYDRTFLSYWSSQNQLYERYNDKDDTVSINPSFSIGKPVMTCLDTENKIFYAIIDNVKYNRSYSNIKDSVSWFAIIDTSSICVSTEMNAVVNLGKRSFTNTMPEGFSSFISGNVQYINNLTLSSLRQRLSCNKRRSFSPITFITLIALK